MTQAEQRTWRRPPVVACIPVFNEEREFLGKLEEARRSVDDLIDTFEMLQDEGFQAELKASLGEAEAGDVVEFGSVEELRKESARG